VGVKLSIIVAATENDVIGKDGHMPWHLPAEAAYFKQTALGHPVITGRKNYEATGRPLPDRLNIVITRQENYEVPDGVIIVNSLQKALELPQVRQADEAFIIGGQQIYEEAMPLIDNLYFTRIHTMLDGDTFFKFNRSEWVELSHKKYFKDNANEYDFTVYVYERPKSQKA
jgi:dihydrofolate reductase